MMNKLCSKCKTEKHYAEFGRNSARKDGLQSRCKDCRKLEKFSRDYKKEYQKAVNTGKRELEKEQRREYAKLIRKKHPWKKRYYESLRRTRKLQATPPWANLFAIKEFYKNCPEGYEVDHIIPLQGKDICGLHVLCNLQYLTPSENRKKSNKRE